MVNLSYSNPAWNSSGSNGAGLSYDSYTGGYDTWDAQKSASGGGFSLGKLVGQITGGGGNAPNFNPAAVGVNTTQLDGQAGFFEGLAGFGGAILKGIGVQPEGQARVQKAGYFPDQPQGGIGVEQIAVFGLIGAGLYFAFKK